MMKLTCLMLVIGLTYAVATTSAFAYTVTLTTRAADSTNGIVQGVTEFRIGAYEVVELVSFPASMNRLSRLEVVKDGHTMEHYVREPSYNGEFVRSPFEPVVVAGPALIKLTTWSMTPAMCTFKVSPESFPPDRTIIVPPGTNAVAIALECSTNLVHWFPATNGMYGNLPEAKFFRIKAERIP